MSFNIFLLAQLTVGEDTVIVKVPGAILLLGILIGGVSVIYSNLY